MTKLTIDQAVQISGRSESTIQRAKKSGEISAEIVKEGRTRKLLFDEDEIRDWAATARVQPAIVRDGASPSGGDGASLMTQRQVATERHAPSRSVGDKLATIEGWYESEGRKLAERQHAMYLQSERLAAALDRVAAASAPVLSLAEARAQFKLSERDLKKGADAGAIMIRRGARGARTVLRAHVAAWAAKLYEDSTCA
jgi:hypothetical protein